MTVEDTLDALYAGTVEGFTAARDAAAKALKAAGDAEGAKAVKAQHKPTQAAHALNRLVRDERARLEELFEIGRALTAAQQGHGGDLHALIERQRGVIQALASKLPAADSHAIISVVQGALVDSALAAQLKLARFSKLPDAPVGFFGVAAAAPVAPAAPAAEKKHKPKEDDGAARRAAEAKAAAEEAETKARHDAELRKAKTDAAVAQADADAKDALAKNLEFNAREARKVADAAAAHAARLGAAARKLEGR